MDDMGSAQALWIGACQILSAVFPGTSRSMSTIVRRPTLGHVASGGAGILVLLSISYHGGRDDLHVVEVNQRQAITPLALRKSRPPVDVDWNWFLPFRSSSICLGRVFMAWVRRRGFVPFAVYRIALELRCWRLPEARRRLGSQPRYATLPPF